jgi:hypothetical protein
MKVKSFLAIALAFASPVWASAPSPESRFQDFQICQGGENKGTDCMFDADCPGSKCVLDWVTGPGTKFKATVTVVFDQDVRDWRNQADLAFQALSVVMEVKAAGDKHMLAETYQDTDPTMQPEVLGWGGVPFDEGDFLGSGFCNGMLYATPDVVIADALRDLAGLPATKRPVISKVIGPAQIFPHDGADRLSTVVRCKVQIRFFNEP